MWTTIHHCKNRGAGRSQAQWLLQIQIAPGVPGTPGVLARQNKFGALLEFESRCHPGPVARSLTVAYDSLGRFSADGRAGEALRAPQPPAALSPRMPGPRKRA